MYYHEDRNYSSAEWPGKAMSLFVLIILLLSTPILILPKEQEVSAQSVPEYQDASDGLPTTSLWVARPEFFDLNNDGSGDLTILGPRKGPGSHSLHMFAWDGNSWTDTSTQEGTDNVPHWSYGGHEFGDLNNDGNWDVGTGSHGAERVDAYMRSFGTLWLQSSNGLGNSEDAWNVDVGDYNNDGNLDLLVGGFWGHDLRAYAGDGNGNWIDQSDEFESAAASHAEGYFCDVNNDGNLDAVANLRGGSWCYLGDGNGGWTNSSEGLPGGFGVAPAFGDFNNDGNIDIAFCTGGKTYAFEGDGTGQWTDRSDDLPDDGYVSMRMTDLNNDNNDDLVCMYGSDPGRVDLYLSNGMGNWTKIDGIEMLGNAKGRRINAGDFDHNGYRDIVAGFGTEEEFGSIRVWKETTIPTELGVILDYPDGKEYLSSGSVRFIRWRSMVPADAGTRTVKLELSTSGVSGPWSIIDEGLPDSGIYQWVVPDEQNGDCRIRITVEDSDSNSAVDVSDTAFGIDEIAITNHVPTIELLEPSDGGEPADEQFTIEWSAEDEDGDEISVNLYYDEDTDPNNGMHLIAEKLEDTGQFMWDTSKVDEGTYAIYGRVEDELGESGTDYSEGTVTIDHETGEEPPENQPPTLEITQPDGLNDEADTEFTIRWEGDDPDPDTLSIDLYYDTDQNEGNGAVIIVEGLSNDGSYSWDIHSIEEGEYYILGYVDDNNGSRILDYSSDVITVDHEDPPPPDDNEPPEIEVSITAIEDQDDSFTIEWTATDPDEGDEDDLIIDLYYDEDTDPEDGKIGIITGLEQATGEYEWDVSDIPEDTYYIYAMVTDPDGEKGSDHSEEFSVSHPVLLADFEITFFNIAASSIDPGETVFIQAKVKNVGESDASGTILITAGGDIIHNRSIEIDQGKESNVNAVWIAKEGNHTITIEVILNEDPTPQNNLESRNWITGEATTDPAEEEDDNTRTYLIGGSVIAIVVMVAVLVALSKKRSEGVQCPECGRETEFFREENDHYCWNCEEYIGER
jgi:hypothetical protein